MVKPNKKWKNIKNFPGYQISCVGEVKSLERRLIDSLNRNQSIKEKILKTSASKRTGYSHVILMNKGTRFTKTIHLLVISHFGPEKPSNIHQCNHKDGIKSHNWIDNLEWLTPSENQKHSVKNGLKLDIYKGPKLNKNKVKEIRKLHGETQLSYSRLAKIYEVSIQCIYKVVKNKTWVVS